MEPRYTAPLSNLASLLPCNGGVEQCRLRRPCDRGREQLSITAHGEDAENHVWEEDRTAEAVPEP
ncbi:hypothetical protein TRIUR3_18413 [Triticum urartu]|uniref:Uncharacterized protein n=1 Tax=Triticum urartu TaxID=4572 RepID=M7ZVC3_TRIUA|nr:hypothetical protein TRIUR3_18413 [Triticum urartu]